MHKKFSWKLKGRFNLEVIQETECADVNWNLLPRGDEPSDFVKYGKFIFQPSAR
jgi:hypothetical protein